MDPHWTPPHMLRIEPKPKYECDALSCEKIAREVFDVIHGNSENIEYYNPITQLSLLHPSRQIITASMLDISKKPEYIDALIKQMLLKLDDPTLKSSQILNQNLASAFPQLNTHNHPAITKILLNYKLDQQPIKISANRYIFKISTSTDSYINQHMSHNTIISRLTKSFRVIWKSTDDRKDSIKIKKVIFKERNPFQQVIKSCRTNCDGGFFFIKDGNIQFVLRMAINEISRHIEKHQCEFEQCKVTCPFLLNCYITNDKEYGWLTYTDHCHINEYFDPDKIQYNMSIYDFKTLTMKELARDIEANEDGPHDPNEEAANVEPVENIQHENETILIAHEYPVCEANPINTDHHHSKILDDLDNPSAPSSEIAKMKSDVAIETSNDYCGLKRALDGSIKEPEDITICEVINFKSLHIIKIINTELLILGSNLFNHTLNIIKMKYSEVELSIYSALNYPDHKFYLKRENDISIAMALLISLPFTFKNEVESIQDYLRSNIKLEQVKTITFCQKLDEALQFIHGKQIFVLDISSENVMIVNKEEPLIVNFNHAETITSYKTKSMEWSKFHDNHDSKLYLGEKHYRSPSHIYFFQHGQGISQKFDEPWKQFHLLPRTYESIEDYGKYADEYNVGILMLEMLTGDLLLEWNEVTEISDFHGQQISTVLFTTLFANYNSNYFKLKSTPRYMTLGLSNKIEKWQSLISEVEKKHPNMKTIIRKKFQISEKQLYTE
eukprot:NODE_696_length_4665_cov_0.259965.p1 type:complete len:727 gc:universal NODE_696_length_4665_cov_0.259965:2391-211(-)